MANKWKRAQMELFDGQPVEKYRLSFKGSFSSEEVPSIENLGMDDHVCLLVIAELSDSGFSKNAEEEIVRVNKLNVLRAVELQAQVADYALAKQASAAGAPMLPVFEDPDDRDDVNGVDLTAPLDVADDGEYLVEL